MRSSSRKFIFLLILRDTLLMPRATRMCCMFCVNCGNGSRRKARRAAQSVSCENARFVVAEDAHARYFRHATAPEIFTARMPDAPAVHALTFIDVNARGDARRG